MRERIDPLVSRRAARAGRCRYPRRPGRMLQSCRCHAVCHTQMNPHSAHGHALAGQQRRIGVLYPQARHPTAHAHCVLVSGAGTFITMACQIVWAGGQSCCRRATVVPRPKLQSRALPTPGTASSFWRHMCCRPCIMLSLVADANGRWHQFLTAVGILVQNDTSLWHSSNATSKCRLVPGFTVGVLTAPANVSTCTRRRGRYSLATGTLLVSQNDVTTTVKQKTAIPCCSYPGPYPEGTRTH